MVPQKWANVSQPYIQKETFSPFRLHVGYVNSVITTIEKRFEIGSLWSGLIAASVEIGCLVAVVFVSYLGGCRHIPDWIGCGAILQVRRMFAVCHSNCTTRFKSKCCYAFNKLSALKQY